MYIYIQWGRDPDCLSDTDAAFRREGGGEGRLPPFWGLRYGKPTNVACCQGQRVFLGHVSR